MIKVYFSQFLEKMRLYNLINYLQFHLLKPNTCFYINNIKLIIHKIIIHEYLKILIHIVNHSKSFIFINGILLDI